jgi:putative redox protein
MQAIVKRIGNDRSGLVGKAESGHWLPMDTSVAGDGHAGANSPMEMVLLALGGCTAMDVLSILKKKRVTLDDIEIVVDGDRADTHPRVFTAIRLTYHFYGANLVPGDLEQAVGLSQEKYCSVAGMLRETVQLSYAIEIHPARAGS